MGKNMIEYTTLTIRGCICKKSLISPELSGEGGKRGITLSQRYFTLIKRSNHPVKHNKLYHVKVLAQ